MNYKFIFECGAVLLLMFTTGCVWFPLRHRVRGWVLWLVLLLPLLAIVLYDYWGSSQQLFLYWQKQTDHEEAMQYLKKQKNPLDVVRQLEQHLEQRPDQPQGWYLLGNIYVKQNRLKSAYVSYQKAYHYDSEKLDYLLALCQLDLTLYGVLHSENRQLLMTAQRKVPTHLSVISLLAFDSFAQKQYSKAIQLWERILTQLPAGSQEEKQVLAMIAKAQSA